MAEKNNQITVADLAPHVHSFLPNENKVDKLVLWLKNWIDLSLECGKIKPNDFLPTKGDLACHIGVSIGTIQSVYRRIEDDGYIKSKQRIGSYINDRNKNIESDKLTSKRDIAYEMVKKYIAEEDFKIGDKLISSRKLAQLLGVSNTIINDVIKNLVKEKILLQENRYFVVNRVDFQIEKIRLKTLVEKIADKLEIFIENNLDAGAKLPPNSVLVEKFNVSTKTIHDAIKLLSKKGILYTRRGQYGTIVLNKEGNSTIELYEYEKFEEKIKKYIISNCQINDKLPPVKELAKLYNTSEKTIKKALNNLSEDGYLAFVRGRYGGTFVLDIPQDSSEMYKWLAISGEYIEGMN